VKDDVKKGSGRYWKVK